MGVYRATVTTTVMLEAPDADTAMAQLAAMNLEGIGMQIDAGDWIGSTEVGDVAEVPPADLRAALLNIGKDGSFFDGLRDEDVAP